MARARGSTSALINIGTAAVRLGGAISGAVGSGDASDRADRRLAITEEEHQFRLEDREIKESEAVLQGMTASGVDQVNNLVKMLGRGESQENIDLFLDKVAIEGGAVEASFEEDYTNIFIDGDPIANFSNQIVKRFRQTEEYNKVLQKGDRHKLLAIRAIRDFELITQGLKGTVRTTKGSAESPEGLTQTFQQSFSIIDPEGRLKPIATRKFDVITRKVINPNTSNVEIKKFFNKEEAEAFTLAGGSLFGNNTIFAGTFFAWASPDGNDPIENAAKREPFNNFMRVQTALELLEKKVSSYREIAEAVSKGERGALAKADEFNRANTSEFNVEIQTAINLQNSRILGGLDDIDDVFGGLFDEAEVLYIEQIDIKKGVLDKLGNDYGKVAEYYFALGGAEKGGVPIRKQDDPNLAKFLSDLPEGIFDDGILSQTEIEAYFTLGLSTIASGNARENMILTNSLEAIFGESIADEDALKPLIKYNTEVNKQFGIRVNRLLSSLTKTSAKEVGSPIDILRDSEERSKLELAILKNNLDIKFIVDNPALAMLGREVNAQSLAAQGILFEAMQKILQQQLLEQAPGESFAEVIKFNTGFRLGLEELVKGSGGNSLFINGLRETIEVMETQHIPRMESIIARKKANLKGADTDFKAYKRKEADSMLMAWVYMQSHMSDNSEKIKAYLTELDNKESKGEEKLTTREISQRSLLRRMQDNFSPKQDIFGLLLTNFFTKDQMLEFMKFHTEQKSRIANPFTPNKLGRGPR